MKPALYYSYYIHDQNYPVAFSLHKLAGPGQFLVHLIQIRGKLPSSLLVRAGLVSMVF